MTELNQKLLDELKSMRTFVDVRVVPLRDGREFHCYTADSVDKGIWFEAEEDTEQEAFDAVMTKAIEHWRWKEQAEIQGKREAEANIAAAARKREQP